MPPKKKSKRTKSKTRTSKPAKKTSQRNRVSPKKRSRKVSAKKKAAQKKRPPRKAARKKRASVSAEREVRQEIQNRNPDRTAISSRPQSDFQGLSRAEEADSESVDELVEEGNVFEAGAVAGVEEADNQDEREVHTHEVPEDDVPEEYLDKD